MSLGNVTGGCGRLRLDILQTSASVGSGKHDALTIVGGCCGRLVEIEDTLRLFAILVSQLCAGCRWSESFDSSVLLFHELVLLERHVAHESTLWGLNLIEKLPLIANLDREYFGAIVSIERIIALLEFRFEIFGSTVHLEHFILQLCCLIALTITLSEILSKLLFFLRSCPVFFKYNHHLASICIFCINCAFSAHFDNLANLVL